MARENDGQPWSCYILRCRDGSFYVGITHDVKLRLAKHNQGQAPLYTARRRPVRLVWSERFPNKFAA